MQRQRSAPRAAQAAPCTYVCGLKARPTPSPCSRASAIVLAGSGLASTWNVTLSPPARAIWGMCLFGSETIRWTSRTPPRSCTIGAIDSSTTGPIVIGSMKCPSPTSKWKIRVPALSSDTTCSPRLAKSAAYSDGSISTVRTQSRHATVRDRTQSGGQEDARALEHVLLDLAFVDAPVERVHDAPAAHPLAVEIELTGEQIQPAADHTRADVPAAVAEQRGDVERRLADDRLRVDRKPRLALGAEDVAPLEVLMADDDRMLRARELD